jgi:hypothetical protein
MIFRHERKVMLETSNRNNKANPGIENPEISKDHPNLNQLPTKTSSLFQECVRLS